MLIRKKETIVYKSKLINKSKMTIVERPTKEQQMAYFMAQLAEQRKREEEEDFCESCDECGWMCEFPQSHVRHCNGKCGMIQLKFEVSYDENNGDIILINLETGEEIRDEL